MKNRKIFWLAGIMAFLVIGLVSVAQAAEFRTDKAGNVAITNGSEEVRNLYTAGNMVSVSQDIKKDLLAAGNIITLEGQVEDDFWAAGNTVVSRGSVGGSLRAAGSNVLIEGPVKEDVLVVGGNVTIAQSATISGDLIIAGGNLIIDGPVNGNILVGGGQLTINSKIGGSVKGTIDDNLKLGEKAEIAGNLTYKAPKEATMVDGSKVMGKVDYTRYDHRPSQKEKGDISGILTAGWLLKMLISFIAGLILVYLLKSLTGQVVKKSLNHFWSSLGFGFAFLILTPIVAIILLVTIIGSWLGGLLFLSYFMMLMLAGGWSGVILGSWLMKLIRKKSEYPLDWLSVLLGVVVLGIMGLIPIVGWLVCLVFFLIALGSIYRIGYQAIVKK